jgi:hypothetical protein
VIDGDEAGVVVAAGEELGQLRWGIQRAVAGRVSTITSVTTP